MPFFNQPTNWSAGWQPIAVAVADFNTDGNDDLAIANNQGNTVTIRKGNGNGTFQAGVSYASGGTGPTAIAVADFNSDGKLDLAVTNSQSGAVAIFRGNGLGGFLAAVSYITGNWPTAVATGDVDGNGTIDLAIANYGEGSVSILLGLGNGNFIAPINYEYIGAYSIALDDINSDGKLDIIAANRDGGATVMIRRGNGNGTFQNPLTYNPGNSYIESIAVADLTGDGKPDVITASAYVNGLDTGGKAYVLKNNGSGSLLAPVAYNVDNGVGQVLIHEMNGDGIPDLLSLSPASNSVSILLGNGNGTFQPFLPFGIGLSPTSLAIGDFNNDSNPDLAVANNEGNADSVTVALNSALTVPAITVQPSSHFAFIDLPDSLSVSAAGQGPLSYLWQRDGSPLSEGSGISGTTTPTLVFNLINPGHAGVYECVVTNACGNTTSHPATLTVIPRCTGDFNFDGQFDGLDVQLMVDALLAGQTCP